MPNLLEKIQICRNLYNIKDEMAKRSESHVNQDSSISMSFDDLSCTVHNDRIILEIDHSIDMSPTDDEDCYCYNNDQLRAIITKDTISITHITGTEYSYCSEVVSDELKIDKENTLSNPHNEPLLSKIANIIASKLPTEEFLRRESVGTFFKAKNILPNPLVDIIKSYVI